MGKGINVYSEIGKLNTVLLHRLGREIEGLVPDNFERLLFDEIPYLEVAQHEHDCFARLLQDNGVEVRYFADEVVKAVESMEVRKPL
jgi:arginine deiminase